jgi:undecaprenyl-diphosphatase
VSRASHARAAWAVASVAAAVFAALALVAATDDPLLGVDATAHAALYDALGVGRLPLVTAITWLGNNATIVTAATLLSAAFLLARRPEWTVRLLAASGGGAFVITGLKALFARERPLEQVVEAAGWSFPSGHAFASTVFYGVLTLLVWRATPRPAARWTAAIAAVLIVAAVGLSRVYLNVHFLTDVVAGSAAGVAWLIASQQIVGEVLGRRDQIRTSEPRTSEPLNPQSLQTHSKSRNDADTSRPA